MGHVEVETCYYCLLSVIHGRYFGEGTSHVTCQLLKKAVLVSLLLGHL